MRHYSRWTYNAAASAASTSTPIVSASAAFAILFGGASLHLQRRLCYLSAPSTVTRPLFHPHQPNADGRNKNNDNNNNNNIDKNKNKNNDVKKPSTESMSTPSPSHPSAIQQALGMAFGNSSDNNNNNNNNNNDFDSVPFAAGLSGGVGGERIADDETIAVKPGHSEEDAFGEADPLIAMEQVARRQRAAAATLGGDAFDSTATQTSREKSEKKESETLHSARKKETSSSSSLNGDDGGGDDIAAVAGAAARDAIISQTTKQQRHRRRRRNVDAILGDVLHDALKLRDMGHKPTADFVYKRSQERLYEEEYGHKPPSAKEHAMKYVPFPPDLHLHRLLPLEKNAGDLTADVDSAGEDETLENTRRYSKNYLHLYRFLPEDPWPARAITAANPVWTKRMVEKDRKQTNGRGLQEWESHLYKPRAGYDVVGEFCDAMDELAYWEVRLLTFLRDVPLSQRRSLPYLHEFYRFFVHRVIRAEKRYIATRNATLALSFQPIPTTSTSTTTTSIKTVQEIIDGEEKKETVTSTESMAALAAGRTTAGKSFFNRSEEAVERIRSIYAEAHRSLSSPTYDPLRMKKSALAPFMRMTESEFKEWQAVQKQRRNALVAELS